MKPVIFYNNVFDLGTITASTTASGYDADNVADWRTYTYWKASAAPSTLTVDCTSPQAADYALVKVDAGCTIKVYASTDNFSGSNVLVASRTVSAAGLYSILFASVSYRYWRLEFSTASPAVSIAAIGARLTLPDYLPQGFDPVGRKSIGMQTRNENGQPLGAVTHFREWSETLKFQNATWTYVRGDFLTAWDAHLENEPFGFGWDQTTYPDEIYIVTSDGAFEAGHQVGSRATLSFKIRGVAE